MKLLSLVLILLVLLPAFGQEGDQEAIRPEDLEQRVQVLPENSPAPSEKTETVPAANLSEEDAEIAKLEAERARQNATAVALNNTTSEVTEKVFNAPEELKKLGYESLDAVSMMDKRVIEIVRRTFKESPLKNMTDSEVKKLIMEKAQGSPLGNFLHSSPKITATLVELLKDENALPQAVGIFLRKDDLKIYAMIWVVLMIIGWALKRFWVRKQKKWTGTKVFLVSLAITAATTLGALSTFYNMFYEEISPTTKILVKHWRRRNLKS